MKKAVVYLVVFVAGLLPPDPLLAQRKEIIELQTSVRLLQEQVRELQRTLVERTTQLQTLVEQAVDAANRMRTAVADLERVVRESQANADARVDSLALQVQALRDSFDETSLRIAKLAEQLADARGVLQSVDARLTATPPSVLPQQAAAAPVETPPVAPTAPIPSADTLYAAALRDFTTGKYDLARQQFADYLKFYGETPLAGNAQFYIGETYYQQKDYQRAISEYDVVLTRHPKSYKIAAAQLKKAYALIELNDRDAGIRSLRQVIREHPNSEEARLAQRRLERLGVRSPESH